MPHIHDKIDFCSEVFIVFKNTVLLRKHDKLKIWLSVGGHIELNEDPNEAAIREVTEEVGLEISLFNEDKDKPDFSKNKVLISPQYLDRHSISDQHEHIAFIYFAKSDTNKLKLSDTEVAEDCRWFTKDELLDNKEGISENVKFYALKALSKLAEI